MFLCISRQGWSSSNQDTPGIIPLPYHLSIPNPTFSLGKDTKIASSNNEELLQIAKYFAAQIQTINDYKLSVVTNAIKGDKNTIFFELQDTIKNKEGYTIRSNQDRVIIQGKTPQGVFYGAQTLLQIAYSQRNSKQNISILGFEINDGPTFAWRGMHMDVTRHFFPIDFVKKMIDAIALFKFNTFHWHLTDDQGWRIEIKKYPKLTQIGGWRKETVIGHMSEDPLRFDKTKYGGYYTQDQIREVVAYAKSRFVTIVPEIEMPGHAMAALSAYPEISCTNDSVGAMTEWGVAEDVYCAGKEKTFDFLENVLSEVIDLFPGQYIHIGGDECPKNKWKSCPDCQKRIRDEKLKNEEELQGYFTKRIERFLASKGKKMIGWDEILDSGELPAAATVMSWRGTKGGITASKANHDVVMTPGAYCYFDHYQGHSEYEPLSIGGYLPLEKVYSYNPIPEELTAQEAKHILGAQANLWTEYITTEKHFEYMAFPRLCALSEILWTPKTEQNYSNFLKRMGKIYKVLDAKNMNYRIPMVEGFSADNKFLTKSTTVTLTNEVPGSEIRYTTNGSEPTISSPLYKSPFSVSLDKPITLKAKVFLSANKSSTARSGVFEYTTLHKDTIVSNPTQGIDLSYYNQKYSFAKNISGKPTIKSIVTNFSIPDTLKHEWFGLIYNGYIKIGEDGIYRFSLNSDDGSLLYLDNQLVINNDGFHYGDEKTGQIALKKGYHTIKLKYFQGKYGTELGLKIKSANSEMNSISDTQLWH